MPNVKPIYPELVCAIGLRWLQGGSYKDISEYMGVNYTSFKWFWSSFLCDIRMALELAIKFPGTLK